MGARAWPSPTTIVTPTPRVCSEPGREQGRASPSDSAGREGEAKRCAKTSLRSHSGQGELGLFSSSEKWAQNLPSSY